MSHRINKRNRCHHRINRYAIDIATEKESYSYHQRIAIESNMQQISKQDQYNIQELPQDGHNKMSSIQ